MLYIIHTIHYINTHLSLHHLVGVHEHLGGEIDGRTCVYTTVEGMYDIFCIVYHMIYCMVDRACTTQYSVFIIHMHTHTKVVLVTTHYTALSPLVTYLCYVW